jgi:hypothetical protein
VAHAAAVHSPFSPDDFAIRQQGLINCLCPESSHWLPANPAFWISRLTDNAFCVRTKFRVMGPRRYCMVTMSLAAPVSLSGTYSGTRLMPRYPINYFGGFGHTLSTRLTFKRTLASSNTAYIQALQSISVTLQSARAHSISVAREFPTLDSPPTLPYTAGPLPQVPPPSSPARLLVPRFYALNPTPVRPLPDVAQ